MLHVNIFLFSPIQENTYVLHDDTGNCAIIDPGCYFPEERQALSDFIRDKGLKPILLLNTHCHLDHVFGNLFVAETFGLQPHIHPLEKPVLDFAPTSGLMWNLPFDHYTGPCHYLQPGSTVHIGTDVLEVLFTPGHSPGSVSFYSKAQDFVISGDVLFRESIGRTDLPGGDPDVLATSIRQVLYRLPDDTKVWSGHGQSTTIGWEKQHNPYVPLIG